MIYLGRAIGTRRITGSGCFGLDLRIFLGLGCLPRIFRDRGGFLGIGLLARERRCGICAH